MRSGWIAYFMVAGLATLPGLAFAAETAAKPHVPPGFDVRDGQRCLVALAVAADLLDEDADEVRRYKNNDDVELIRQDFDDQYRRLFTEMLKFTRLTREQNADLDRIEAEEGDRWVDAIKGAADQRALDLVFDTLLKKIDDCGTIIPPPES